MKSFKSLLIGLSVMAVMAGCATAKPFPSENIVISAPTAFGRIYVRILKGRLDEEHKGEWWVTEERFIELKLEGKLSEPLPEDI